MHCDNSQKRACRLLGENKLFKISIPESYIFRMESALPFYVLLAWGAKIAVENIQDIVANAEESCEQDKPGK